MPPLARLQAQLVDAATSDKPRVPDAGRLLWRAFVALHNARTVTMAGAQAITHPAIQAFAQIERLPLRSNHVQILRAMDDAWLAKERRRQADRGPDGMKVCPRVSSQEMSSTVFDVLFS